MTVKELAYTVQRHIQEAIGTDFKRSHAYELLSAAYGFRSFAAIPDGMGIFRSDLKRALAIRQRGNRAIEMPRAGFIDRPGNVDSTYAAPIIGTEPGRHHQDIHPLRLSAPEIPRVFGEQ